MPDPFPATDKDKKSTVKSTKTLPDSSVVTTWSSNATERKFTSGVTVSHTDSSDASNLEGDADNKGSTVVTLADKTTIETDGSASEIGDASGKKNAGDPFANGGKTSKSAGLKANGALITLPDGTRIRATAAGVMVNNKEGTAPRSVAKGPSETIGGATVIVNQDGSSTLTIGNTKVVTDSDGVSTTTVDGSTGQMVEGDGSITAPGANGARETRGPDGAPTKIVNTKKTDKGIEVAVSPDNNQTKMTLPGASVESMPDDGNRVKTTLATGVVVDTVDISGADDSASNTTDGADGQKPADKKNQTGPTRATSVTLDDGTLLKFGPTGVTYTDKDGKTTTKLKNTEKWDIPGQGGVSVETNAGGVATLRLKDNTKVVVDQTGSPTTTVPADKNNGKELKLGGDGSAVVTEGLESIAYDTEANVIATGKKTLGAAGSSVQTFSQGLISKRIPNLVKPNTETVINYNAEESATDVRTEEGGEILMGNDSLKAMLTDGSLLTINDEGNFLLTASNGKETVIERSTSKTLVDGTTIKRAGDGSLKVVMKDKTELNVDDNGAATVKLPPAIDAAGVPQVDKAGKPIETFVNSDGTITVKAIEVPNTNNTVTSRTFDLEGKQLSYSEKKESANGVIIEKMDMTEAKDGVPKSDGHLKKTYASNPMGDITINRDEDEGRTTTEIKNVATVRSRDDGTGMTTTLADGSTVYFDGDNWIFLDKKGKAKVIKAEDGPRIMGNANADIDKDGNMKITIPTTVPTNPAQPDGDKKQIVVWIGKNHETKIFSNDYTIQNNGTWGQKDDRAKEKGYFKNAALKETEKDTEDAAGAEKKKAEEAAAKKKADEEKAAGKK